MIRIALLALLASGCQYLIGLEATKLQPDAPTPDAPPDASVDGPPGPAIVVGTGKDGPLTVTETVFTDNVRTTLTMPVLASSTTLHVGASAGFAQGDELLIMQMDGSNAGQYETVTVMSTLSTQLLTTALKNSYEGVVQIVRVPNYTDVTVTSTGVLTARTWDEATGGIVVFRAKGRLLVEAGGQLTADALGYAPGMGGAPGLGGAGGPGGGGGARAACPSLCNTVPATGGSGSPGQSLTGAPGGPGDIFQMCKGGDGATGGQRGMAGLPGTAGTAGSGPGGGATPGAAGTNTTANLTRLLFGGGGAGGAGGAGGRGAGGGGGGGGPIGNSNGTNGGTGNKGGDGATGGEGGRGGGIVIVHAMTIEIQGIVSARGANGAAGDTGAAGGTGGDGGFTGNATSCNGLFIRGGRGAGGNGANGGDGGSGGGGGGGGVIDLVAFTITMAGEAKAHGGVGGALGPGGLPGEGGTGFDDPNVTTDGAQPGADGLPGAAGTAGGTGAFYLRFGETCNNCMTGDPPAMQMML